MGKAIVIALLNDWTGLTYIDTALDVMMMGWSEYGGNSGLYSIVHQGPLQNPLLFLFEGPAVAHTKESRIPGLCSEAVFLWGRLDPQSAKYG
jgi:hypothetical protein